jgi:hypothetical protein
MASQLTPYQESEFGIDVGAGGNNFIRERLDLSAAFVEIGMLFQISQYLNQQDWRNVQVKVFAKAAQLILAKRLQAGLVAN